MILEKREMTTCFSLFPRNDYGINEEGSLSDMRTWTISIISILEMTTLFSGIHLWIWSREIIIPGFQYSFIPVPLSSALVSAPVSGVSCLARGMEFRRLAFGRPEKITEIIAWRLELAHLIMQFHITVIKLGRSMIEWALLPRNIKRTLNDLCPWS